MDFNPDTWGTVAEWVGSIGTTLAFLATFVVIRRDADVRLRAQARKVVFDYDHINIKPILINKRDLDKGKRSFAIEFDQKERRLAIINLSDEPIYDVSFERPRAAGKVIKGKNILLPNKEFEVVIPVHHPIPLVYFRDNSGQAWYREERGRVRAVPFSRPVREPERFNS